MNYSYRILLCFFLLIAPAMVPDLSAQEQQSNGPTWYTDLNKAYELSTETKKPIFALFTGSDWCIWCHRLGSAVLEKPGFAAWAKTHVILLELDSPRQKQLPEPLAKQNSSLQQFFQVQGFPTVWLFNMSPIEGTN